MKVRIKGTVDCSECGSALYWIPPTGEFCKCCNPQCSFNEIQFECPTVELKRRRG